MGQKRGIDVTEAYYPDTIDESVQLGYSSPMRTLFGKPIRQGITDEFFPHKLTLEEFKKHIQSSIEGFTANMNSLGGGAAQEKFVEEWHEQYLNWLDVEQEP